MYGAVYGASLISGTYNTVGCTICIKINISTTTPTFLHTAHHYLRTPPSPRNRTPLPLTTTLHTTLVLVLLVTTLVLISARRTRSWTLNPRQSLRRRYVVNRMVYCVYSVHSVVWCMQRTLCNFLLCCVEQVEEI